MSQKNDKQKQWFENRFEIVGAAIGGTLVVAMPPVVGLLAMVYFGSNFLEIAKKTFSSPEINAMSLAKTTAYALPFAAIGAGLNYGLRDNLRLLKACAAYGINKGIEYGANVGQYFKSSQEDKMSDKEAGKPDKLKIS